MHHSDLMTEGSVPEGMSRFWGSDTPTENSDWPRERGLPRGPGLCARGSDARRAPRWECPGNRGTATESQPGEGRERVGPPPGRTPNPDRPQAHPPQARRTHGGLAGLAERVVGEALHQAGLAHAAGADDDDLQLEVGRPGGLLPPAGLAARQRRGDRTQAAARGSPVQRGARIHARIRLALGTPSARPGPPRALHSLRAAAAAAASGRRRREAAPPQQRQQHPGPGGAGSAGAARPGTGARPLPAGGPSRPLRSAVGRLSPPPQSP